MIRHLAVDTAELSSEQSYRLLTGCVIPRPIALVSTLSPSGVRNLAPFSFFNLVSTWPPTVMVSIDLERGQAEKDTSQNIRATGEFVVNLVSEELGERMVAASLEWPEAVDELELAGFTALDSRIVGPPRVGDSPVNLECRSIASFEFGDSTAFFGEVLVAHVDESALDGGKVDSRSLRALGRLAGIEYCATGAVRAIPPGEDPKPTRDHSAARTPAAGLRARARD